MKRNLDGASSSSVVDSDHTRTTGGSTNTLVSDPYGDITSIINGVKSFRNTLKLSLLRELTNKTGDKLMISRKEEMKILLNETEVTLTDLHEKALNIKRFLSSIQDQQQTWKDIIKLNLRGVLFETTKETLLRIPNTYFCGMLSGYWEPDDGVYFIDCPPDGFQRILEYLSTGEISYAGLNEFEIKCIDKNLDYFGIPIPTKKWEYNTSIDVPGQFYGVAIQLADGRICSATKESSIKIWNLSTNACEFTLEGHDNEITALLSLSSKCLCSSSWDETIKLWDVDTGFCQMTLSCESTVWCMVVLSDGQLCTGDSAGFIQMWDLSTGELERCYPGHSLDVDEDAEQDTCCVRSLIQLQDGRLGTASVDHTVRVWTQSEGDCVLTCIGHKGPVNSVVQLRDGRLCSGSDDRALIIWSVINGECLLTLEGHLKGILSVIEMQDGSICSGTWGGKVIRIWEPMNGECVKVLAGILGEIISVFQLQDGRLCGIADNHNLRIWF